MGRKNQTLNLVLPIPMEISSPRARRVLTWPRVRTDGEARTFAPLDAEGAEGQQLHSPASIATAGCMRSPDLMWSIQDAEEVEEESGSDDDSDDESVTDEGTTMGRRRRRRGRRGRVWQPPAAPNTSVCRPCAHNSWDNVRVKKDKTTLRCRVCQLQWKVDHAELIGGERCPDFGAHSRCPRGKQCGFIHIHRFKLNLPKRKAIWGENLLMARRVSEGPTDSETQLSPAAVTPRGGEEQEQPAFAPSPSQQLHWGSPKHIANEGTPLPTPSNASSVLPTFEYRRSSGDAVSTVMSSSIGARPELPTPTMGALYRTRATPPQLFLNETQPATPHVDALFTPHPRTPHSFRRPSDSSTMTGNSAGPPVASRRVSYQPYNFQQPPELVGQSAAVALQQQQQQQQQSRILRTAPPPIHVSQPHRSDRSGSLASDFLSPSNSMRSHGMNLAAQHSSFSSNPALGYLAGSPRGQGHGLSASSFGAHSVVSTPSMQSSGVWTPGHASIASLSARTLVLGGAQVRMLPPQMADHRRMSAGSAVSGSSAVTDPASGLSQLVPQAFQTAGVPLPAGQDPVSCGGYLSAPTPGPLLRTVPPASYAPGAAGSWS